MKISRITEQNFRGIRELKLELDGKSTVIFGVNGVGKSKASITGVFRFDSGEKFEYYRSISRLDFSTLFEWFRIREDLENQEKVRQALDHEDRDLKAVRKATLAIANPVLIDPLEGSGGVLIDELELHMHTQWQRNWLP